MTHAQQQLKNWRQALADLETGVTHFKHVPANDVIQQFINIYLKENSGLTTKWVIKQTRKIFEQKIKYWKTVVRYPVQKNEVLIVDFHPKNKYRQEAKEKMECASLKFPFKAKITRQNYLQIKINGSKNKTVFDFVEFITSSAEINRKNKIYYNFFQK